jgi:hypothetical protein
MRSKASVTPEKTEALQKVVAATTELREARTKLKAKIEEAFQRELIELEFKQSLKMNQAKLVGVAESKLQAATGIANWYKFKEALAIAADAALTTPVADEGKVSGPGWTFNPDSGILHIHDTYEAGAGLLPGHRSRGQIWYAEQRADKPWLSVFDIQGDIETRWADFTERLLEIYTSVAGPQENHIGYTWDIPVVRN